VPERKAVSTLSFGAEGEAPARPIDSVVRNTNEIAQNLTLIVENPQYDPRRRPLREDAEVACAAKQCARIAATVPYVRGAAAEIEGTIRGSTADSCCQSLSDQVTRSPADDSCTRYPLGAAALGGCAWRIRQLFSRTVSSTSSSPSALRHTRISRPAWAAEGKSSRRGRVSPENVKQFKNAARYVTAFLDRQQCALNLAIKPPLRPASPGVDIKHQKSAVHIATPQ